VRGLEDLGDALVQAWADPGGIRTLRLEVKDAVPMSCTIELWEDGTGPSLGTSWRLATATGPHEWVCDAISARIIMRKVDS